MQKSFHRSEEADMPKHERFSPKGISNNIKSKGLQKLRWFCQMCNKQCRDENGFKCHTTSESHQRQLLLFAENPDQFLDDYSKEFEKNYLDLLRRRFGTKRVHANIVYQEYIAWKEHLHMNATIWETLTEFIKHLGRSGKCVVDQTEKGWFVQYVDRDPETIARHEELAKKQRMDKDDEERMSDFVQKQAERARELYGAPEESAESKFTELLRTDDSEKITISLKPVRSQTDEPSSSQSVSSDRPVAFVKPLVSALKRKAVDSGDASEKPSSSSAGKSARGGGSSTAKHASATPSALDEIRAEEERRKEFKNRKDYWLHKGITVKVITKKLGEQFYKQKGVVKEVLDDNYTAIIKMVDTGDKVKVDQAHLETVIPAIGKRVLVVNGAYRECVAILEKLDERNFCVSVRIDAGPTKGRLVDNVKYEDICKLADT